MRDARHTHPHIIHDAIANSFVLPRFEANKSSVKLIVIRPPSEKQNLLLVHMVLEFIALQEF